MDSSFFQDEQILEISVDERMLYQRSVSSECMILSVMRSLSAYTHVSMPLLKYMYKKKCIHAKLGKLVIK